MIFLFHRKKLDANIVRMTSFWHAYWWSLRTFCMLYFSISCVQITTDANIGCELQFLNAKSLVIPAKESGVETQKHILAALQLENENACAQFCCDFDLEESEVVSSWFTLTVE